jgi:cytosine permease
MASYLPGYVTSARPVPLANRTAWYLSTAPTYAGIVLWFAFWQDIPVGSGLKGAQGYSEFAGGTLAQGLGVALVSLIVAALVCHYVFYLVPGKLGVKTGLPLYIVGTSTYGVLGGFLMPGFLMGLVQFGGLAVNSYFSALLLCQPLGQGAGTAVHAILVSVWAVLAAFMGLKGIQYVGKVASFLQFIPLAILVILFFSTVGGLAKFDYKACVQQGRKPVVVEKPADEIARQSKSQGVPESEIARQIVLQPKPPLPLWGVVALIWTYVVGYWATACAAGADFGMNNRDEHDVKMGGLVGIAGATIFSGGLSLLIAAGMHGAANTGGTSLLQTTALMGKLGSVLGDHTAALFSYLLAVASFPPACFSSFIAANCFRTTLPKVNPFISCGIGTAVAILLAVTGLAGNFVGVFKVIGACFAPICGAMVADYLLAGRKWAGPRAGFNLAGWISWVAGFAVGAADSLASVAGIPSLAGKVPCPPVAAFLVGFVLYLVLALLGLQSRTLEMPAPAETKG